MKRLSIFAPLVQLMIQWQRMRFLPSAEGRWPPKEVRGVSLLSSGKGKQRKGYPSVSLTADSFPLTRGAKVVEKPYG